MNRQQLSHILRAASAIADDNDILVVGSQAILGTYDEDELPAEATASIETDIAFWNDPDRAKADAVEGSIGEMSSFQVANGVYAEGVDASLVILPEGWQDRVVTWDVTSSHPAEPRFLERHDLAVAKLAAARSKDYAFVVALLDAGMLDPQVLLERIELLARRSQAQRSALREWVRSYVAKGLPRDGSV